MKIIKDSKGPGKLGGPASSGLANINAFLTLNASEK
jgi:hypothetical protein